MLFVMIRKTYPKLSIQGNDGIEKYYDQWTPEIWTISYYLTVETQLGKWKHDTSQFVVNVLQVYV